jgi:hypothetical protein
VTFADCYKPQSIGCSAACKREVTDMDAALAAGWECLPITGRWRCPDCTRELVAVRGLDNEQDKQS